jgi:orotidine-5'-phosphate decarboxylase
LASFGSRLAAAFEAEGRLCVGIDAHSWLLAEWGLPDSAAGAREFGLRVVEAASGKVCAVKPQVAFYERFGSAGYAALEDVLATARTAGLLVMADAKRGDVGSSVEAYGQAWLTPGSPLEADAMTVSAYQGVGSLDAPRELALRHGKGLFLLAATSNPEAARSQRARVHGGSTVAAEIVQAVAELNERDEPGALGSMGLVLGATLDLSDYGIRLESLSNTPILAPGFGHQGASIDQLTSLYGAAAGSVIVSVSRSILAAGPSGITAAIESEASLCRV